jgi:DNA repair exonuclease SbcCD nuclease subunit
MKPSALLSADQHWREDKPVCRTDKFPDAFIPKAKLAKSICEKHSIPMLIAGDISEYWKNYQSLIYVMLKEMPRFICIPGQHDLPRHNLELLPGSTLSVLEAAKLATVIKEPGFCLNPKDCYETWPNDFIVYGYPYGTKPQARRKRRGEVRSICMIHQLVTNKKDPFPNANASKAEDLLDNLTGYDLILSGDNHKQFTFSKNGRHLINPGSMVRQDADQINHQPKFYLWYAEDNHFEPIDIPIDNTVVVRSHIEKQAEIDKRIDNYINSMDMDYEVKLDFRSNLETHIIQNNIKKEVSEFITQCLEN